MLYDSWNYFVHHAILRKKAAEHNISETESVSILRWGRDSYSIGYL
jgi:hypothetical protein